jgi:hypothetical protein
MLSDSPGRLRLASAFHRRIAAILSLATLLGTALPVFAYPDLVKTAKPNPEPALPASFDAFTPPVTAGSPLAAAPVFAEWTRNCGPYETLVVTGFQFSAFGGANEGRDTRFLAFGQTTAANPSTLAAKVRRQDGGKAALTLDQALPADGMYLLWAGNESGFGAPVPINKTDAWWIGPERATRGGTVSVYGRDLTRSRTPAASVYVKAPGNVAGVWATVAASNPYKVDFLVPTTLANGSYEVWTHNGRGGHYGWSGPLTLTVDNGPGWTATEYSVKTFGAKGDGTTDDFATITAALNYAAARPLSTVFFPAGTYKISDYLDLPANVRLRGASRDTTTIKLTSTSAATAPVAVLAPAGNNVEVRDLALTATGALPTNKQDYVFMVLSTDGWTDLRFTNLRINGPGCDSFYILDSRRVFFSNCEITGHNGYLKRTSQAFFAGCSFRQTNDAAVPVWVFSGRDMSMSGCTTRDLDSSNAATEAGWGMGRWFVGNGVFGTQRNVYLGDNTSTDLGVRPGQENQNSGEQFLWEQNNQYFAGAVASATASSAVLSGYTGNVNNFYPGQNDNAVDCEVIVVAGKGLGQHRAISAVNPSAGSITLAEPWNVIPDGSSRLLVMTVSKKVAIFRNYLDGKPYVYQQEPHIASAGVEPFDGALDFVVDGNTFHELRNALSLWGYSDLHQNRPVYFGLYANNVIQNNRWGVRWWTQSPDTGINFLGNVFRRTTLRGVVFDGFSILSDATTANPRPWVNMNVIERTTASDLPLGITRTAMAGSTLNTIMLANTFTRGTAALSGSRAMTFVGNELPCLRGNTYSGFEKSYDGVLPGAILEVPIRVVTLDTTFNGAAKAGSVDLWNAGNAPLNWTASSSAAWLKLSTTSGTIANESAWSALAFSAIAQGLPPGTYTGYLTISGAAQTKVIKVSFVVR